MPYHFICLIITHISSSHMPPSSLVSHRLTVISYTPFSYFLHHHNFPIISPSLSYPMPHHLSCPRILPPHHPCSVTSHVPSPWFPRRHTWPIVPLAPSSHLPHYHFLIFTVISRVPSSHVWHHIIWSIISCTPSFYLLLHLYTFIIIHVSSLH